MKVHAVVEIGNAFLPSNSVFRGPGGTIGNLVSKLLPLVYFASITLTAIYFIFGATQFIYSGGDPKAKEAARKKIQYAVIGFTMVALSFLIVQFLSKYLHLGPTERFQPTTTRLCNTPTQPVQICRTYTCSPPEVATHYAHCPRTDPSARDNPDCWGCAIP